MRVLIACEESQTECIAFRALGHEAYNYMSFCTLNSPSGVRARMILGTD